jgi:hypothetical protein
LALAHRAADVSRNRTPPGAVLSHPAPVNELIADRDRHEMINEPSIKDGNRQRCPVATAGAWRLLSQGYLPLVQIAGIGRALLWVHRADRLAGAEHRTAPAGWL